MSRLIIEAVDVSEAGGDKNLQKACKTFLKMLDKANTSIKKKFDMIEKWNSTSDDFGDTLKVSAGDVMELCHKVEDLEKSVLGLKV